MSTAENEIRRVLEDHIPIEDELAWCWAAEECLDIVMEGIVMRRQELEE